MSAYEPPDTDEDSESGVDPAEKGKDVVENRDFSAILRNLDSVDYVIIAALLAVPTSMVATILVVEFAPGLQDAAGELLRGVVDGVLSVT